MRSCRAGRTRMALSRKSLRFSSCRCALDDPVDDPDPLRIGAGQLQHMPVAAIHHAIEAECIDRMRDIGLDLFARPVLVIGFGGDAGNLAMDIGQRRKFLQLLPPGIGNAGLDRRLADMIEHEAHLGALLHHLDRIRQVMVEDADVEDEIMRRQQLQRLDEIGLDAEIRIGLVLDQAAHAAQSSCSAASDRARA